MLKHNSHTFSKQRCTQHTARETFFQFFFAQIPFHHALIHNMATAARTTYINKAQERSDFIREIDEKPAVSFVFASGVMMDSFTGFAPTHVFYRALAKRSVEFPFNYFTQEIQNSAVLSDVQGLDFTDLAIFTFNNGAPFDPASRVFGQPDDYFYVGHLLLGHTCALLNSLDEDLQDLRNYIDTNGYQPSMMLHQYSNVFATNEYNTILNDITSDSIQATFTLPTGNKKGLAFAMKVFNDVTLLALCPTLQ